jgi:hypothetical protein
MTITRTPFQWNNSNFAWNDNPYTWNDCALVAELVQAGRAYEEVLKDKEKKKRFIKLLCQVEGKEYKETKEVLNRKIRISDISLVAKEVLGINIKIEF